MNPTEFKSMLSALDIAQWQALADGASLQVVDDNRLIVSRELTANVVQLGIDGENANALRDSCLAQATTIFEQYYITNPLSQAGFEHQVRILVEQLGARSFCAVEFELPDYSLFVEAGQVVAEGRDQPRHRYGAWCELSTASAKDHAEGEVENWIASGTAYRQYLSMNVCRYNC